jgi:hypothetical protein
MVPNANNDNTEVILYPDGSWEISKWNLQDPKPLNADVEKYWNDHGLDYSREQKIKQLEQQCDAAILGGFDSYALGVKHTYQSMLIDEVWFNSTLHRFNIDPNFTTVQYKTVDAGYLPHNKIQFQQVFIDGHTWGDNQIAKLNGKKNDVANAQDEPTLDAITW